MPQARGERLHTGRAGGLLCLRWLLCLQRLLQLHERFHKLPIFPYIPNYLFASQKKISNATLVLARGMFVPQFLR